MALAGFLVQNLTVANGAQTSDAGAILNSKELGLEVPSSFDGTSITFTVCSTSTGTFQALYVAEDSPESMAVTAGRSYSLPATLTAWPFFKIVCDTAQTGATVFVLVGK